MARRVQLGLLVLCQFGFLGSLVAENRFYLPEVRVPAGGLNRELTVRADNDVPIFGFSIGINYDEAALTVKSVTIAGTESSIADFFNGRIDTARGLVGYGCVLDWDDPLTDVLPAGTNHAIMRLFVDVLGAAGTSTQVRFENVPTNPDPNRPVKCVMTNEQGQSVAPTLVPGTVIIEDRSAAISSITGSPGIAGDTFQVVGDFFGEPGLTVKVCSVSADFELAGDGRTLTVTAPECATVGFAPIEVCNDWGCDSDAQGFEYVLLERPFIRADSNFDGVADLSDGVTILLYLFAGTVSTTCPDAFDANDSGDVDISDAIYVFTFLFLGGADIPAPFPDQGVDPSADTLPLCE